MKQTIYGLKGIDGEIFFVGMTGYGYSRVMSDLARSITLQSKSPAVQHARGLGLENVQWEELEEFASVEPHYGFFNEQKRQWIARYPNALNVDKKTMKRPPARPKPAVSPCIFGLHAGDGEIFYVGRTTRSASQTLWDFKRVALANGHTPVHLHALAVGIDFVQFKVLETLDPNEPTFGYNASRKRAWIAKHPGVQNVRGNAKQPGSV